MEANYINTFARIESLCTFSVGFGSLMKSISFTKQSNLFLHFFRMFNASVGLSGLRRAVRGSVYILKTKLVTDILLSPEVTSWIIVGSTRWSVRTYAIHLD